LKIRKPAEKAGAAIYTRILDTLHPESRIFTVFVTIIILLVVGALLGIARLILGPIYRMNDGCACGQQRAWLSFDKNSMLRDTKFALTIAVEGDQRHRHQYWDATWVSCFWFLETPSPPLESSPNQP